MRVEGIKMEKKKILKGRAQSFSKQYATNVLLSETDSDVRLYAFNEILDTDDGTVAVSDGAFILTYQATVLLYEQLKETIDRWSAEGRNVIVSEKRRELLNSIKDQ